MHWEKEIRIRITWRRIVGTILAASTVANLVIVGAVYGADAPPAPINASVTLTSRSPSTVSMPGATAVETSTSALTPIPGITPTDTFTPTQMTDDPPGWFCIKKFYWPTYYVQPGDKLFWLALNTSSSVGELMAANCLANDWIYIGQRLYVPRLPVSITSSPTTTPTATQTPTATATPSQTSTNTATITPSPSMTDTLTATQTFTDTPSATPTNTLTPTPTDTPTETNFPPDVSILSPRDGSHFPYDGFDQTKNLWYSIIELRGNASDQEDDVLSDSSLFWSTDFNHPQTNAFLGNGTRITATLYSNVCSGMKHTITFTGRDSHGNMSSSLISISIGNGASQC